MKQLVVSIFWALLFATVSFQIQAQVTESGKATKEEATQRTNSKIDEEINKTFDKLEGGIKGMFGKKKKRNKDQLPDVVEASENTEIPAHNLDWAKFDFISGNKVIYEDNLEKEENGEFPSRWDLVEGRVENANFDFSNVIYFMSPYSKIVPFLENPDKDYLPEAFTLEFDVWFEKEEYSHYNIWFFDHNNQQYMELDPVLIYANMASLHINNTFRGYYPGFTDEYSENSHWRHVSIAFNKRSLKVYLDDTRVLNIPNLGINPQGITIGADPFNVAGAKGINRFIKNVRLAEGGTKLYDKYLQDGKIVASGIRFDVNNATLKPESMGIINNIAEIMNDNPELKFSVEGHTDNDGDDSFNQRLSEERAQVVVDKLVALGIEKNRLSSKGFGETVPLASNSTPEGKANNRRVEFVKN